MNFLEISLIRKAGYDNGWEVVDEERPERVVMSSALHHAQARVTPDIAGGRWILTLSSGRLSKEVALVEPVLYAEGERFRAANDIQLGTLLRHAAHIARSLPDLPLKSFASAVAKELSSVSVGATEVERMVRQRVGQDVFRESLMEYWGGACAVTGIELPELLRASHAKPWAECESDAERLNVFNGFLLVANLDALFDRFLMTFDDDGQAIFAKRIDAETKIKLGISGPMKLRWISKEHRPFLEWHRKTFAHDDHGLS